jgi:hypothetical protein
MSQFCAKIEKIDERKMRNVISSNKINEFECK